MEEFIESQIDIFKKYELTYYSINIELKWCENESKFKKIPKRLPSYRDKTIKSIYDPAQNATIILLGEQYGGIIGIDVDNKNDTVKFFINHALDNDCDLNTLTVKTINDGFHYYFKLTQKQMEQLKDFRSSTGMCFSTETKPRNIDIKYTNQFFYGPSYFEVNDKTYKYEVETDTEIVYLPEYLFEEIVRVHKKQSSISEKKEKTINNEVKKPTELKKDDAKIERLKLYLDC
jgi:hypothetical protein